MRYTLGMCIHHADPQCPRLNAGVTECAFVSPGQSMVTMEISDATMAQLLEVNDLLLAARTNWSSTAHQAASLASQSQSHLHQPLHQQHHQHAQQQQSHQHQQLQYAHTPDEQPPSPHDAWASQPSQQGSAQSSPTHVSSAFSPGPTMERADSPNDIWALPTLPQQHPAAQPQPTNNAWALPSHHEHAAVPAENEPPTPHLEQQQQHHHALPNSHEPEKAAPGLTSQSSASRPMIPEDFAFNSYPSAQPAEASAGAQGAGPGYGSAGRSGDDMGPPHAMSQASRSYGQPEREADPSSSKYDSLSTVRQVHHHAHASQVEGSDLQTSPDSTQGKGFEEVWQGFARRPPPEASAQLLDSWHSIPPATDLAPPATQHEPITQQSLTQHSVSLDSWASSDAPTILASVPAERQGVPPTAAFSSHDPSTVHSQASSVAYSRAPSAPQSYNSSAAQSQAPSAVQSHNSSAVQSQAPSAAQSRGPSRAGSLPMPISASVIPVQPPLAGSLGTSVQPNASPTHYKNQVHAHAGVALNHLMHSPRLCADSIQNDGTAHMSNPLRLSKQMASHYTWLHLYHSILMVCDCPLSQGGKCCNGRTTGSSRLPGGHVHCSSAGGSGHLVHAARPGHCNPAQHWHPVCCLLSI